MASIAFPKLAKQATFADGTTYGYIVVSPGAGKPTFLLLHGYPSSSYDWRHQISDLTAAGYGVIAPDLLGYGDTDKPEKFEQYSLKRMSFQMRELLDVENVQRCIAPASTFTLIYAANPQNWKTNLAPVGAAAKYVRSGKVDALPSWYPLDEYTMRDRIFAKSGYRGPMAWYKAAMRGVNTEDDAQVDEKQRFCHLPTLLVVSSDDHVTRADLQTAQSSKWCTDLRVEMIQGCGHWIQLEQPGRVFELMERFAAEVTGVTIKP
nr:epoxide hydrolase a [Quercus suber]